MPQAEKSSMLIVSELARYNKLNHEYRLLDEAGPAHSKIFNVALTLSGEEYVGHGSSIKKAQQDAAKIALERTSLPIPTRNCEKRLQNKQGLRGVVNSVALLEEVYGVAKQLGLPVFCTEGNNFSTSSTHQEHPSVNLQHSFAKSLKAFRFYVTVGQHRFNGYGKTLDLAKIYASLKTLNFLSKAYQLENSIKNSVGNFSESTARTVISNSAKTSNEEEMETLNADSSCSLETIAQTKSPVSALLELAIKHKLNVHFEVVSDDGPNHCKQFEISCGLSHTNGDQLCECKGVGVNKKVAKREAAMNVIKCLLDHHDHFGLPVANVTNPQRRARKSVVKELTMSASYGQQLNPVSRLLQVQQIKKAQEPLFTVINEVGQARYKEFVVQVTIDDLVCEGSGPNKKLAKRAAAEAILEKMGLLKPLPKPGKPLLKTEALKDKSFVVISEGMAGSGSKAENVETTAVTIECNACETVVSCDESMSKTSDRQRKVKFVLDNIENVREKETNVPGLNFRMVRNKETLEASNSGNYFCGTPQILFPQFSGTHSTVIANAVPLQVPFKNNCGMIGTPCASYSKNFHGGSLVAAGRNFKESSQVPCLRNTNSHPGASILPESTENQQ